MPLLQVIVASTRPGRKGLPIGQWFHQRAVEHGGFDAELVDLAEVALPLLDEPNHPRLQQYQHAHTKAWSAMISRADAYAFVMPEYNFSFNAALKNALDYLLHEWSYKPAGLVSYGGVSAGLRAASALRPVLSALNMTPLPGAVSIPMPFVPGLWEGGELHPNAAMETSATELLDELVRVTEALTPLRVGQ